MATTSKRNITLEYAIGYDNGFSEGYRVGAEDGFAKGFDAATRQLLEGTSAAAELKGEVIQ